MLCISEESGNRGENGSGGRLMTISWWNVSKSMYASEIERDGDDSGRMDVGIDRGRTQS